MVKCCQHPHLPRTHRYCVSLGYAKLDELAALAPRPRNNFPKRNESKAVYAVKIENPEPSDEEAGRADSRQVPFNPRGNQNNRYTGTLDELKNKKCFFKREKTFKIFKQALEDGLELPRCKRHEEADMVNNPKYCPYHRVVSHPIEDRWVFKDLIEQRIKDGRMQTVPQMENGQFISPKRPRNN